MKISIIQYDPLWEAKQSNMDRLKSLMDNSERDTDLFVLPEMFTTGFSMNAIQMAEEMNGETVEWMKGEATTRNTAICGTLPIRENELFFNRFIFITTDGSLCHYDKRHLHTSSGEHNVYHSGNHKVTCEYMGVRFSLQVCYDLRFPVWSRNRGEADVIIYSASWPGLRIHAWKSLLIARAIENQCYVIGANRTGTSPDGTYYPGSSMIIDPTGMITASLPEDREGAVTAVIDMDFVGKIRKSLPALDDADDFSINI